MAYENTVVSVAKSQEAIRKLIMRFKGTGIAFITQTKPPVEGFEATMEIEKVPYRVRITATVKVPQTDRYGFSLTEAQKLKKYDEEQRRVWRVLYYQLKATYESAESGVMEFRELMLPYIVMNDNQTIAQHIVPKLNDAMALNASRLLPGVTE